MHFLAADAKIDTQAPFLVSLSDGLDEPLRIVLAPAKKGRSEQLAIEATDPFQQLLARCIPLIPDESCRYEVVFESYLLYQVRNESYAAGDSPDEVRQDQGWFSIYDRSRLLSHIGEYTDAQRLDDGSYYPDAWRHYEIITQDHIIDVVAFSEPTVRELRHPSND